MTYIHRPTYIHVHTYISLYRPNVYRARQTVTEPETETERGRETERKRKVIIIIIIVYYYCSLLSALWVSRTGSASEWCALQEALYK